MTPRIEMIWEDVCAADFSTPDGIRAFTDRACSEYTAEELVTYLDYTSEHQRQCMTNGHEGRFRHMWEAVADEAKDLIALIRGFGAGGIKSPLIETADGGKVIHPCLHDVCDMTTGKPIDELYDQTVVSLRRMAARAMENNATVQDVAQKVDAARDEIADSADETQIAVQKGFEDLEPMKNGVKFLVGKKQMEIINGREAQKNAAADPYITKPKERAAADMARAVLCVRDDPDVKAGKHGALKKACVRVCDEFDGTGRKLPNGKFSQYTPLMDWRMKPIKWESLRRAYNKKHGRLRKTKSGAKSKPKRVTK